MGLTKYGVGAVLQTPADVTHRKAPMRRRYLSIAIPRTAASPAVTAYKAVA